MTLTGCGGKPKGEKPDANKPEEKKEEKKLNADRAIVVGAATNSRLDAKTREKLWDIAWKQANLAMVDGQQSGTMQDVTGNIYDKGKVASTFSAKHGEADKAVNRLIIEGDIKVTSIAEKSVMTAKKVEWLADLKVFKASGDVLVEGPNGVVGPTNQVFATADLKKIGTSVEYFKQKSK